MMALTMCESVAGGVVRMCSGVVRRRRTYLQMLTLLFIWLTLCATKTTDAFNVDKENVIQYHGDPQTMFGFSVAEHKEQGRSWVLIGAPEASDATAGYNYKGGAVFYCDTEQNDSCRKILQSNYLKHEQHNALDNNTRQWLGATVRSSGENGAVLVCAPRYFWFRQNGNSLGNRDPVGTCFLSTKGFADFAEYSPCRNKNPGHNKQGMCEVGYGAAISKDSNRIYIGAVGAYYWQGQLLSILHTHLKLPYEFDDHQILYDVQTGAAYSRSVYREPTFMVTKEGPKTTDDSYLGYSMASIEYMDEGSSKIAGVISGVPRGDRMVGKVRMLTWNLIDVRNITGEQFASYFGYSVAVADVDGDGADDVIIGAPMYSDYNPNKLEVERGRVYVFYQTTKVCAVVDKYCWETKFVKYDFLDGAHSRSRFGLSLASLGDINQDGYQDFAVGAPYEGATPVCGTPSTVTGAVYIYHGSKNGVRKKFSQVILASEMSRALNTFGFSLAGGIDVDNNTYPDLVVGAYESDTVFLFKSRPVIQLDTSLAFNSSSKMIGLNDNNCELRNSAVGSCVKLEFCMKYGGVGVPDMISLDVRVTLDAKQAQSPRMFFVENEGSNIFKAVIPVHKGNLLCKTMKTYITRLRTNQDKLTPLEAELTYSLIQIPYTRRGALTPVLSMDDETPFVRRDSLNIKNNCGADNVCKPNLNMKITSNQQQYILGSGHLIFNVSVHNVEEDSFGTVFKMKIPPGVSFSKFEDHTSQKADVTVQCYPPKRDNNYIISCDVGNPLPSNKEVKFSVVLEPRSSVEEAEFEFWADVTTKNPQVSSQMRPQELSMIVPIVEETHLLINSESSSSQTLYYNASQYEHEKIETDVQAGPFVRHEYTIKNLGPSDVLEAQVVFDWPSQTPQGDDLLYLFAQPKTEGPIQCERVTNVNYRRLQITRRFNDRYTERDTVSTQESSAVSSVKTDQTSTAQKATNLKWGANGNVNQVNSKQEGKGSTSYREENQSSHHSTYATKGAGEVYQSAQRGGSSGAQQSTSQGGQWTVSRAPSSQGAQWAESSSGSNQASNTYHGESTRSSPGGFWSVNGDGYQSNKKNGGGSASSVYESESSYHKNTVSQDGNVNTYEEGKWKTNDNGRVRNGSFARGQPTGGYSSGGASASGSSYDNVNSYQTGASSNSASSHRESGSTYNSNRDISSFFEGQSVPIVTGEQQTQTQRVNLNLDGKGTAVHRQQVGEDILTTYDEGVSYGVPQVRHRGSETEDIYHNKSVSLKYGKPTELPSNFHVPKSWVSPPQNIPHHRVNGPPPLRDSEGGNDDEETGDGEGEAEDEDDEKNEGNGKSEADETENYDEEPNETSGSSKQGRRRRRSTVEQTDLINKDFCSLSSCTKIVCTIGKLPKDEEASVIFPAIAWARTIRKLAYNRPVEIGSHVVVNITKLPHLKTPKLNVTYTSEILTNVTSMDYVKTPPDVTPLWIVVASACLGTLILMLVVYLLYKSGFFKRNRPPHLPERQPLNRNGGYNVGDEAL